MGIALLGTGMMVGLVGGVGEFGPIVSFFLLQGPSLPGPPVSAGLEGLWAAGDPAWGLCWESWNLRAPKAGGVGAQSLSLCECLSSPSGAPRAGRAPWRDRSAGTQGEGSGGGVRKPPLLTPASSSLHFGAPGVNRDNPVIWASPLQRGQRGERLCACSRVPQHHPSPPSSWLGDAVTAWVSGALSLLSTPAPAAPATSPPLNLLSCGCSFPGRPWTRRPAGSPRPSRETREYLPNYQHFLQEGRSPPAPQPRVWGQDSGSGTHLPPPTLLPSLPGVTFTPPVREC